MRWKSMWRGGELERWPPAGGGEGGAGNLVWALVTQLALVLATTLSRYWGQRDTHSLGNGRDGALLGQGVTASSTGLGRAGSVLPPCACTAGPRLSLHKGNAARVWNGLQLPGHWDTSAVDSNSQFNKLSSKSIIKQTPFLHIYMLHQKKLVLTRINWFLSIQCFKY